MQVSEVKKKVQRMEMKSTKISDAKVLERIVRYVTKTRSNLKLCLIFVNPAENVDIIMSALLHKGKVILLTNAMNNFSKFSILTTKWHRPKFFWRSASR